MSDDARDLLSLLHMVAQLTRLEADRRARVHGMTLAQWRLLLQLERAPGLTQKEVADLLEVEPISVARLVDRLEAARLLERRPDAEDRRVWRLHLRPESQAALGWIDRQGAELSDLVVAGIDAETRATLMRSLQRMKENLARGANAQPKQAIAKNIPIQNVEETV